MLIVSNSYNWSVFSEQNSFLELIKYNAISNTKKTGSTATLYRKNAD